MKIKNPFYKSNILLVAPVIFVMLLDLFFTFWGQPEIYWQNFSFFSEGSPLGQFLMLNPLYFFVFFAFYLVFVTVLTGVLPRPLNFIVALSFYLGHIWGSSSWLDTIFYKLTGIMITGSIYWYLNVGYLIIISIVSGIFWNSYIKSLIDKK
jgi:hypothetical protein